MKNILKKEKLQLSKRLLRLSQGMKPVCVALLFVLMTAGAAQAQVTLAKWTFETSIPITSGPLTPEQGSGSATSNTGGTFSNPGGWGSVESWSSNGWDVGEYFQFSTSTTGYQSITLLWQQVGSSTGPKNFELAYSTDGTTFTAHASYVSNASSWNGTLTPAADQYTYDLSSVASLNNKGTVYFRLRVKDNVSIANGTVASTGSGRIDNFTISGTAGGGGTGPTISGFSPSSGAVGTSVTISGSNFSSPTVKFNGTAATITASTATSITATVPSGATSGKITVEAAGQTTATSVTDFTVVAAGTPSIIVSPTSATGLTNYVGQVSASTNYTVTGTNLGGTNLVVTASTNAIEVSTNSSTGYTNSFSLAPSVDGTLTNTVYVRISALAPAGAVSATVGNVSGVASNNFTVSGTVTTPALTLVLNPTTVAEDAGASASTGTVGIPTVLSSNLVVSLVSSNTVAATVPSTVTITNGQTNATFAIAAVATTNSYAGATAVITASVTNYTSASATLTVSNVDVAPITTISLASLAADSYTQSFDALGTASIPGAISGTVGAPASLAAVIGSSPLNGWYATKIVGTAATPTAITADTGSGTSALVYSYGAASATDRALGVLASGTSTMAIGALIKNDTGATINSIKVSFTAEFWRSSTSVQNVLTCAIGKVDGSTITTANFLTDPSAIPFVRANITGPLPVSSNGLLDGNAVANQVAFTDVVIPLQLAAGETGFVRWSDFKDAGSNAGLAIDNLKMTASLDLPAADGDGAVTLANSTVSSPYTLSGIWAAGGTSQGVSVNVTPLLDSTTLTSASILVPTEFGVPLVGNVTATGGATGGTPTVVGQLITLNGVSITKANPGVINIAGLSTPTTGTIAAGNGVYPFTVSTAGDGGTLKAVFASPAANVLIPIANIRDIDANGAPVDKNTIVAVEGICTAAPLGATSFIQDASYGIAVFPATTNPAFTLGMVAGRKYAVVGTLVDYNGLAEIKPASVSGVVDLGVASIPTPIMITVAQAKAEQYESMLVTIAGLTKDAAETDPWAVTKTITVKNSALEAIDVRIQSESTATTEPAYPVTITGILAQFSSATPRALTYQIMPRTAADLSFAPGLKLAWSVSPVIIDENDPNLDTDTTYLTLSRVGSSTGAAAVELSISPAGRMLNAGLALPQTVNFAAGETSKKLVLTPVNDTVYTGDTVVTLTATASGLTTATATATIYEDETAPVIDTTKPVIALIGANPLLLANGASYTDPGATVTDNVDALRTILGTGTVNTAVAGDYLVSYNATDAASNAAIQVTRTVRVAAPLGSTYSSWLNGASASDAAFLDYVFGATAPGTLDPSLKPTVAVTGGKLVLTYYVRQGTVGLTVTPKASANLALGSAGWSTVGVDDTADVSPITVNGVSVWRHAASVPVSGLSKFLRIEAVQQ
jgi:Domain of unknown function (DUF5011)